jgi:hypothetical protein
MTKPEDQLTEQEKKLAA